jgi:cytochrome c
MRWLTLCTLALLACGRDETRLAEELTGGDATRGERAFRRYGCGSCHELHGDFTAQGSVGPSFHDFAYQSYLPGGLPNSPPNLIRWIQHPRQVEPKTAMPELHVTDTDARDLAAFLYTMR